MSTTMSTPDPAEEPRYWMDPDVLGIDELAVWELNEAAKQLGKVPADPEHDLAVAQLGATIGVGRAIVYLARVLERHGWP
jgi:hypothetical protein